MTGAKNDINALTFLLFADQLALHGKGMSLLSINKDTRSKTLLFTLLDHSDVVKVVERKKFPLQRNEFFAAVYLIRQRSRDDLQLNEWNLLCVC